MSRAPLITIQNETPTVTTALPAAEDVLLIVGDQGVTNADKPASQEDHLEFNSLADIFEADGTTRRIGSEGTALETLQKIYSVVSRERVLVSLYDGSLTGSALTNAIVSAIQRIPEVESAFGVVPRYGMVPERTWEGGRTAPVTTASPILTALQAVASANNFTALVTGPPFVDGTDVDSFANVMTWGTSNYGSELIGVYPHFYSGTNVVDPVGWFAASMARKDHDFGFWESPTGKQLYGVSRANPVTPFDPFNSTSAAAQLADTGFIVGVPGQTGWIMYGNNLLLAASNTQENHFNKQVIANEVHRLVRYAALPLLGRPMQIVIDTGEAVLKDALDPITVTETVPNNAISGVDISVLADRTSVADARVAFKLTYSPSTSTERVDVFVNIVDQTLTIN